MKRQEDRRSCHSISFVLGLAVAGGHPDKLTYVEQAYAFLIHNTRPIAAQKVN